MGGSNLTLNQTLGSPGLIPFMVYLKIGGYFSEPLPRVLETPEGRSQS